MRASEVDQIDQATPHLHVDHQRMDGGEGPTQIDVLDHGAAERIDVSFGFSMAGVVTVDDSSLTVTTRSMSPADGSVWDGLSPKPSELWVYGPGSAQIGLDRQKPLCNAAASRGRPGRI
jgi:hypothetical protein